ncbi:hypothetical protein [Sphingomonas sp. M1A8_2b]
MLLGIERVIANHEIEPGRFYLAPHYDGEPVLFQCIRIGETSEGQPDLKALRFSPGTQYPISLESIPHDGPLVALPEVHVRIDAPSLTATNHTSSVRSGMFLVAGNEAFVAAPQGFREWALINISTGRPAVGRWREDWAAFSRWLLVIEDNGEEIPIADFTGTETT